MQNVLRCGDRRRHGTVPPLKLSLPSPRPLLALIPPSPRPHLALFSLFSPSQCPLAHSRWQDLPVRCWTRFEASSVQIAVCLCLTYLPGRDLRQQQPATRRAKGHTRPCKRCCCRRARRRMHASPKHWRLTNGPPRPHRRLHRINHLSAASSWTCAQCELLWLLATRMRGAKGARMCSFGPLSSRVPKRGPPRVRYACWTARAWVPRQQPRRDAGCVRL